MPIRTMASWMNPTRVGMLREDERPQPLRII